ncbi:MAG: hypothetical protein ACRC2R_17930 [Xenococcaceae cyanobacterium]
MVDFTFVINLYRSIEIEQCLIKLRNAYPTAPCTLFQDGDGWNYSAIAERYQCKLIPDVRLKLPSFGGMWTNRYLQWFLSQGKTPWLIKIDPDTVINRPLSIDPPTTGLFGFNYSKTGHSVHGGCQGYSREAVKQILDSNFLFDREYRQSRYQYISNKEVLSFQDGIIRSILLRLNIPVFHHPEIYCDWLVPPDNPDDWAIYHPGNYKSLIAN